MSGVVAAESNRRRWLVPLSRATAVVIGAVLMILGSLRDAQATNMET